MIATAVENTKTAWLGEFPAHWEVLRIKNLFQEMDSRSETGSEELLSVSYHTGVYLKRESLENEDDNLTNASSLIGYKKVTKGDLIINIMGAWNGRLGISAYDGITSPAYCVYRLRGNNNPEYYGYLFRTSLYVTEFLKYSAGIGTGYLRLYSDKFFSIFTVVPPKDEQDEIVQYIKAQEEKINLFIQKKQRFIELLKEQRQRIINIAITKGLNRNIEFKSTSIDWLGEVPKHWKVGKLKRFCQVKRGASPRPIDDPIYFDNDGEYGWVRISDVTASNKFLEVTEQKLSSIGQELSVKIEPNDIFLSIAGSVGKPIISKIKCCIHDGFVWFQNLEINKEYLYYIFLSGSCFDGLGKMGTQLNLNTETVGSIFIAIPPEDEIKYILEHIKTETATIDTAIAKAEREIELIREYKEAMIAEAVMGKRKL
ncbi:MAG: restriction endonuclease subunit S [Weeksellaceae bacterium]